MEKKITKFNFLGYYNVVFLTLEIDYENMRFIATNSKTDSIHPYMYNQIYASIQVIGRDGNIKFNQGVKGTENSIAFINALNGFKYENGDCIKFYHAESYSRLRFEGVSRLDKDCSMGCENLDLDNSFFYLLNNELVYTNTPLENSGDLADKSILIHQVEEVINISPVNYTYKSYSRFESAIERARSIINTKITTEEDIRFAVDDLNTAKNLLVEKNKIIFKDESDKVCIELSFEDMNIIAESINEDITCPSALEQTYLNIELYNQKGIRKFSYNVNGNENCLGIVSLLNGTKYDSGDYLKLYHRDQSTKLLITGSVINAPYNLENGCANIDLSNSLFYIEENLKYSTSIRDLSYDTTELKKLLIDLSAEVDYRVTTKSSAILLKEIKKAQALVDSFSVEKEEVEDALKTLHETAKLLKIRNEIIFKGFNNRIVLALRADFTTMQFIASESIFGSINSYYPTSKYIGIALYDKNGIEKFNKYLMGSDNSIELAKFLNGQSFEKGDYLKFYHAEPKTRMVVTESIENMPFDLSHGFRELNLQNTYFFLMNEKEELRFSENLLTVEDYKKLLFEELNNISSSLSLDTCEAISFEALKRSIATSNELINNANASIEDVNTQLNSLRETLAALKMKSEIIFKGRNNDNILSLRIDNNNNKFIATGLAFGIPTLKNRKYIEIMLFDKNNIKKASYSIGESDPTLILANKLNEMKYEDGDYLKFYHMEADKKFEIKGYIENMSADKLINKLDLTKSKFLIGSGILSFVTDEN